MVRNSRSITPELWGGIESSFNRVGDLAMDQLQYCGHYSRGKEDIRNFATLGLKAIRYPLIWEKHQPVLHRPIDWSWTGQQLEALRHHAITPIAGLMHHGNGPFFTNLLTESFPAYFEHYAQEVATKFPWLELYTPINEPLTTARFSGLYGIWHPHKKHDRDFAAILLNQLKATVFAMRAIRKINPQAKLVQTEDLCKTFSTPLLKYQADFENERRWLTYDILCGRLTPEHPLWKYFVRVGIEKKQLYFFVDNPCPPDYIGADHYLTSERFLDHNLAKYPHHYHGGNHIHTYADVEAIRVKHDEPWGLRMLLKECWERYKTPIAVTEVHMNGTSEDQIRWFTDVWDTCVSLRKDDIDITAVTAWALLGSYGWNKLLTVPHGHYEAGAFDVHSGKPDRTVFADFLKQLSADAAYRHPVLKDKGWWKKETRCLFNTSDVCPEPVPEDRAMPEWALDDEDAGK